MGRAGFIKVLGYPHPAIVAQRLAHQREFGLRLVGLRNARGVNLCVARVGKIGAALVSAPRCGDVAIHGIGGKVISVAVAAGGQHHCVCSVAGEFASQQVARDDARSAAIDDNNVDQLTTVEQPHTAQTNLARQLLVGTEQQLLTSLSTGVEGAANLGATKTAVIEQSTIFTSKRHALGNHLVDDVDRHLGQAIHVAFARAEVTTLDGVTEKSRNAVAVTLIVLGCIDATLSGNRVGAARGVMKSKCVDAIAELGKRRRSRSAGQTSAHHDDFELAFVAWVDELGVGLEVVPLVGQRAVGNFRIQLGVGRAILQHGHKYAFLRR